MSESIEIRTLRYISWERAKGELRATLSTYWNNTELLKKMNEEVNKFINVVEDEGLIE